MHTDTVPNTLIDMLQRAAQRRPHKGLRFCSGGEETAHLTFGQLLADASRIAAGLLQRAAVAPLDRQRVALVMATTPDCVAAFFGILCAGAVPVPLPPPMPFSSPQRYAERVGGALQRSRISLLLGDGSQEWYLRQVAGVIDGVQALPIGELRAQSGRLGLMPGCGDEPALVQYTSGSTSSPKGVVLSHRQVLSNLESIRRGLAVVDEDVGCFWLPLFHDMGLIGGLLASIYSACECVLMPPEDYVRDPGRWLELFGRYRGTISAAPNAAYLHCVKRVAADRKLDLSSWRAALNGAERIDAATMRQFSARFASSGFRAEAIMPVYGMAEAALAVSFSPVGGGMHSLWLQRSALAQGQVRIVPADDPQGQEIVAVGSAVHDTEVRICGADGAPLGPAQVGEIHLRGGSLMGGYDRDEEATQAALRSGWLATGDLGFCHEGRLYVTGRRKEIIIVRGENFYASDVEQRALGVTGVAPQGALALGVPSAEDGTEALVLLVETRELAGAGQQRLLRELRASISACLGIAPAEILTLPRGELPRTSSGKPERHKGLGIYQRHKAAPGAGEIAC